MRVCIYIYIYIYGKINEQVITKRLYSGVTRGCLVVAVQGSEVESVSVSCTRHGLSLLFVVALPRTLPLHPQRLALALTCLIFSFSRTSNYASMQPKLCLWLRVVSGLRL